MVLTFHESAIWQKFEFTILFSKLTKLLFVKIAKLTKLFLEVPTGGYWSRWDLILFLHEKCCTMNKRVGNGVIICVLLFFSC